MNLFSYYYLKFEFRKRLQKKKKNCKRADIDVNVLSKQSLAIEIWNK